MADLDLLSTLRSTGAVRSFRDEPVGDDCIRRVLDTARFAPSGGNRQSWRVVVARSPEVKRRLRDLYLPGWYEYLSHGSAGLVPFAATNDPAAEQAAVEAHAADLAAAGAARPGFAERFDEVPVLLVVLADLGYVAAVDKDLGRYGLAGGASVFPFVWSILLAARAEGLGGVPTTMVAHEEPEVLELLGAPPGHAVACVVALGYPEHQPTRLRRASVDDFASIDRVGGPPLGA